MPSRDAAEVCVLASARINLHASMSMIISWTPSYDEGNC